MSQSAPYRFFGAFRLALALLVMVQHSLRGLIPHEIGAVLLPMEVGSTAVLLFFVLSGFIVAEAADRVYDERPFAFLANRMIRIYPTYLVALAMMAGTLALVRAAAADPEMNTLLNYRIDLSARNFLLNLFAILPGGNGLLDRTGGSPILSLAWALRIEMLFYFALFAHLLAAKALKVSDEKLLTLSAFAGLAAYGVLLTPARNGSLEFVPYFVLGVSGYYFARDRSVLAGGLSLAALVLVALHLGLQPTRQSVVPLVELAGGLIVFAIVALRSNADVGSRAWVRRDRRLGDLTYPLYLTHYCGLMLAGAILPLFSWQTLLAGFAFSLMIAWAVTRWFERPLARVRSAVRGFSLPESAVPARRQIREHGRIWSDRVLRVSR